MNQLNTTIKNEIYINSFYKHPFITNYNNVRGYILMKQITNMIERENGYRDFDRHLKPDDLQIAEMENNEFSVSIPNIRYDETQSESYNNAIIHHYRFLIDTFEEFEVRVRNYILETLHYIPASTLLFCLRDDAVKEIRDIEPREQSEITYHNDSCSVCMEDYNENIIKKVAICGHCLCNGCWEHIIHSNNSVCPECREVWDEITDDDEQEEIEYDLDDIQELCDEEDNETLLGIINNDEIVNRVLQTDDPCDLLGYEGQEENIEELDTPFKYRQLPDGGNEFKILWMRD